MPATAIQKNAFFQCRCTNGAKRGRNFKAGDFVSVSFGRRFCGRASLPLRKALPTAALCKGRLRRFSVPVPIVVFFTNADDVPFLTKVDDVPLVILPTCLLKVRGCTLRTRGGTLRDGTFRTVTARF